MEDEGRRELGKPTRGNGGERPRCCWTDQGLDAQHTCSVASARHGVRGPARRHRTGMVDDALCATGPLARFGHPAHACSGRVRARRRAARWPLRSASAHRRWIGDGIRSRCRPSASAYDADRIQAVCAGDNHGIAPADRCCRPLQRPPGRRPLANSPAGRERMRSAMSAGCMRL